ncbi:hypothetical protein QLX08_010625 [Tetragonisca angustula]|uniref:Uncharacterized protein n=1 Tax=Tetragonisca angustula TaxID=166442 RepID=A0AAW0ZBU0_9HYME
MLRHIITIGCIIAFATFSKSTSNKHLKKPQHYENTTETTVFLDSSITEVPILTDSTSLKMLEDITAKVWRILPVTNIPQNWVLTYCMRYTEISEDVEKAKIRCQYGGLDWDCTFIELGGGQDDFNIGKIVSLFHNLSNNELRLKLLRAAEVCGKLWQKYKQNQNKRLIRMRLNVRVKNREKRFSKNYKDSQASRKRKKNLRRKKKKERDEEIKKKRRAAKKVQAIRKNLSNKITELENKKTLSPKEEVELNRLRLTVAKKPAKTLEEYPLIEDRAEFSRLQEIGLCLTQQAAKACEFVVLGAIQKLM